jgi:divalent metal cation (Fe/Co/Zn/Cd) transporter
MAGIVIGACGSAISQWTGDPRFDGAASIVLGIILGITAFLLAYASKALLIGEAVDPELVAGLRRLVARRAGVSGVGEVLTVHSSPDMITAMISVDFEDAILASDVEQIVDSVERDASRAVPDGTASLHTTAQRRWLRGSQGGQLRSADPANELWRANGPFRCRL